MSYAGRLAMPWGKYRGVPIARVPSGYLAWCLEETDLEDPHRAAVRAELGERLGLADMAMSTRPTTLAPEEYRPTLAEMVGAGYRALAVKRHPDHGGDARAMQELNAVRDWCRAHGLA